MAKHKHNAPQIPVGGLTLNKKREGLFSGPKERSEENSRPRDRQA
ncbi:hypothetical protein [Klebsiella pneumoniae IS39]|nr:hypothetical protein [Klebsiella pneumoniae IS39]